MEIVKPLIMKSNAGLSTMASYTGVGVPVALIKLVVNVALSIFAILTYIFEDREQETLLGHATGQICQSLKLIFTEAIGRGKDVETAIAREKGHFGYIRSKPLREFTFTERVRHYNT